MKPIIPIAIAVIGIFTLISSGSLLQDSVDVWLQRTGLGSAIATNPVEHISVDWKIMPFLGKAPDGSDMYKNKFTSCSFHIAEADLKDQDMNPATLDGIEKVICKITDKNGNAIGEGSLKFFNGGKINCVQAPNPNAPPPTVNTQVAVAGHFCPSQQYIITSLDEAHTDALLMTEVFDVTIVVIGENPTI